MDNWDDLIDLVAEAEIVRLQDRVDILMENLAVARRTHGLDAWHFQFALEDGIRKAYADIHNIQRTTGIDVPRRTGLELFVP